MPRLRQLSANSKHSRLLPDPASPTTPTTRARGCGACQFGFERVELRGATDQQAEMRLTAENHARLEHA